VIKLNISGIEIEIAKKRIKNMHLSVLPPLGKVRISAPMGTNDEAIRLFAIKNLGWVKKQIQKFENQPRQSEREYVSGESHYLWGRRYPLTLKHSKRANSVEIRGSKIVLTARETSTQEQREKIMNEWYRGELKAKMPSLIAKWEEIIGVKVNDFGVKNMRTKWGTCNIRAKRVWMNLQLAKKPFACLEYIVVHELVHLLEKNHTPAFIEYMDKFMPGWRVTRDQLNDFIMDKYIEE
jgi:hypothetical protein